MLTIDKVQKQVEGFISDTLIAREISEKCRDYYDHKQWTPDQIAKLESRNQAPIVVNRIRPKIKGLVGLYNIRESDPKAFPRTKKHEKAAHAITDGLRYVRDNNKFSQIRLDVAEELFIEGYGGAWIGIKEKSDGIEVLIKKIHWDRIYFDPNSREKDFSDARFMGFYMWLDEDEAKEKFPNEPIDELINSSSYFTDETFEDRPRWFDKDRRRVRVAIHFGIHNSVWHFGIFTEGRWLKEPEPSPFLNDDGEPSCTIELVSANIDRDNSRYGEVLGFLDQQDEINHRRSKALHLLNNRQTHGRRGAINNIAAHKREMSKPDGHIEWDGEEFGKDFGILPTNDQLQGQFELYQDAKSELDAVSFNAQLAGDRQQGDLSGVAIDKLQAAGTTEVNQDYNLLAHWENRVDRQIWSRIKQFWTAEKWIRVTDDERNLKWVGFNSPMTMRSLMEEKIEDQSIPLPQRNMISAQYKQLIQIEAQTEDINAAMAANQQLEQIVSVSNPIAEIDVDIILDQSFDVINIEQEQFMLLTQFAQGSDIDIIELIELSQLRGKDELIEKIEKRRAQAAQAQQGIIEAQSQTEQAKAAEMAAKASKTQVEAQKVQAEIGKIVSETQQTDLENLIMINQPDQKAEVII